MISCLVAMTLSCFNKDIHNKSLAEQGMIKSSTSAISIQALAEPARTNFSYPQIQPTLASSVLKTSTS
jgi:hypothetical protein